MKVQITDNQHQIIWERGRDSGIACRRYVTDGTQQEIINALKDALTQAEAELVIFDDVNRVLDIGSTPAQVEGYVPMSVTRDSNPSR